MKTLNLILSVIFFFLANHALAQIQQGSFRIGGTGGYSKSKMDDSHYRILAIRPSVAYFPISNLSAGLTVSTMFTLGDYPSVKYTTTDYSFGPELRYYFPFGKWAVFPEVVYTFGKTISESKAKPVTGDPITNGKYKSDYSTFRGGAGITYFVNPNVGVEGILFYQNANEDAMSPFSSPTRRKSVNFNIGLQIYFNRK